MNQEIRNSIKEHLNENSQISSNRLFKNKDRLDVNFGLKQPTRYLDDNQKELYKSFKYANQLSRQTFVNYLKKSGQFKKPFRLTDMCEYCEKLREIKKNIINDLREFEFESPENIDVSNAILFMKAKLYEFQSEQANTQRVNKITLK